MDVSTNPVRLHRENTTVPYLSAVFESQVYGAGTVKSQLVVAAPINVTTHVNESRHCSSASVTEQVRRPPGRRPHTQPDGAARRRRRSFNCVIGDSGDSLYSARLGSLKVTATFIINQRLLLQEWKYQSPATSSRIMYDTLYTAEFNTRFSQVSAATDLHGGSW